MRRSIPLATLGLLSSLVACGAAPPPAQSTAETLAASASATPSTAPEPKAEVKSGPEPLPTECVAKGNVCSPPLKWVKKLCSGFYPDVALIMFGKETPWTRGYLTGDVKAWNASGGESSDDQLVRDEEVLVLLHRAVDTGGMQVSGAGGGYDVLRWDGTCASLEGAELTLTAPPSPYKPKAAKIAWKSLDLKVRDALSADDKIGPMDTSRRKECKGVTLGDVSKECQKATEKLGVLIVDYVRRGGALPAPDKLP